MHNTFECVACHRKNRCLTPTNAVGISIRFTKLSKAIMFCVLHFSFVVFWTELVSFYYHRTMKGIKWRVMGDNKATEFYWVTRYIVATIKCWKSKVIIKKNSHFHFGISLIFKSIARSNTLTELFIAKKWTKEIIHFSIHKNTHFSLQSEHSIERGMKLDYSKISFEAK